MIVVAGEALVDLVEEGGMLRAVPGGGPFNTAIALGRLGLPVAYLGTLSRDDYGGVLAGLLADASVDLSLVRASDAPTPVAVVNKHGGDGSNSYTFYLAGTALADFPPASLPAIPDQAVALHVGTLALAVDPPATTYRLLVEREADKRTIVFDPNIRPAVFGDPEAYRLRFEELCRLATVVKMSRDDAAWIYPSYEPTEVIERVLDFGPRMIAVTLGAEGAMAASAVGRTQLPADHVDVVDTVGSGDSFGAGLIASLHEQDALALDSTRPLDDAVLEKAVALAISVAALTSTRTGAAPPSRGEVDAYLSERGLGAFAMAPRAVEPGRRSPPPSS